MAEWRTLSEFPNYEVTEDGDVRNKTTKKVLKEIQNKKTGAWCYPLRFLNGGTTNRNYESLIYSAYPELKPEKVNKKFKIAKPKEKKK